MLATGWLLLTGCTDVSRPALTVSDLRVFAPLPGSRNGVAYLTFQNSGSGDIVIQGAASAQFARVELHQTSIDNGVASMRSVAALTVPAGGQVKLEQGVTHLMLMDPRQGVVPGTPVTLEIQHDHGLLIVDAQLQSRLPSTE